MPHVAVIGAGPMGLAATHDLLKRGYQVTLYEADSVVGGMSAAVNFDGTDIERFYHFICLSDHDYFQAMEELGIRDRLRWVSTKMGFFHREKLKDWGDPWSLLTFSEVSLVARIRYGLMAFISSKRRGWQDLDKMRADLWIKKWVGEEAWEVFWKQLFELKFYQFTNNLSAAWIWARIRRIGRSRKNIFTERLGYLEGGTETYLSAVRNAILKLEGKIELNARIDEVIVEQGRVHGVRIGDRIVRHDAVVSTIPLPFVPDMIPALSQKVKTAYRSIDNIAVVCVLVKLAKPLSKYFWLNISDKRFGIPGIIEYTNLCESKENILYIPYYMPQDHEHYKQPNSWFYKQSREYLQLIDPSLTDSDFVAMSAGRYEYAQPICPPEFGQQLPQINPGIEQLLVADTSYYYPEDRGVSESIGLGQSLASTLASSLLVNDSRSDTQAP